MKEYNSHYLGIVINNNDPEFRGRVQVFVPHIMPALYKGWNEKGEDIEISCIGDNIEGGMTSEILARLVTILPWAEAASPIIGSSSPGGVASSIFSAVGGALQSVAGAIGSAANAVVGAVMDQSPSDAPVNVSGVEHGALFDNAAEYGSIPKSRFQSSDGNGQCGQGARMILGALTNNPHFKKGLSSGGSEKAGSLTVNGGNSYLQNSGMYKAAEPAPANYKDWSTDSSGKKIPNPQWQVGDVFVSNGGDSEGNGHVQVWTGKAWVSDFTQKGVGGVSSRYGNFTLVRMNSTGLAAVKGMAEKNGITFGESSSGSIAETASSSKFPAATSPQQTPEGTEQTPNNPTTITAAEGAGIQGTVSGGGTASDGIAKLAADRQAKFANELNDPAIQKQLGYLASREVDNAGNSKNVRAGSNATNQQQFIETVVNRAMFSNKSISSVISDMGYWIPPEQRRTEPDYRQRSDYQNFAPTPAYNRALNNVLQGGNLTNLATDNASNVGSNIVADRRIADGVTGVWLNNGKVVGKNEGEFYYRGDGKTKYFSTAGKNATKYANENGINQSSALASSESIVAATSQAPKIINNTDGYGPTVVKNTNDMPKGLFAYPNVGAMVWIFFREGNPLFPVYFAASYSADEWKAAYSGSSLAPDGANNGSVDTQINNSVQFNPNAGGGMQFTHIRETSDPTGSSDKAYSMFFGDDGSNMMFAKGFHQIYTRHTRRDQIDGDAFRVVGGYEEKWVTGDSNSNIRGNCLIQIGKIDQESLDALQALANKSAEHNAKLAQAS